MARKREVNYFKEVNSDEELENFLSQKGLLVLDVYQDLFGPCTISLHSTLKKIKLSLTDSDKLTLGVCDAYKVDKLKRFKNKCQPTMILFSQGKIVDIVYGSNIPLLSRTLQNQLELEEQPGKLSADEEPRRKLYELDEPLPFEMEEIERKKAEEEAKLKAEEERVESELHEKLDEAIKLFADNASEMGVTLYMPHVAKDAYKKCLESSKWLGLISRSRQTIQLSKEMMTTLNYKLENPIPDEILERIYGQDIFAVVWQNDNETEKIEKVLDKFVKTVSNPKVIEEEDEQNEVVPGITRPRILDPLIIYLEDKEDEQSGSILKKKVSVESQRPSTTQQPLERQVKSSKASVSSLRASTTAKSSSIRQSSSISLMVTTSRLSKETLLSDILMEGDDDDGREKIIIPPVWSPANAAGNAIFMFTFFRNLFDYFLPPEVEPEPEHLLMVFQATKRKEIFELCQDYPKEMLACGFFTSGDFRATKLICKTLERYEQLPTNDSDRILMKVAHKSDHFALALTTMNILYVSQNTKAGEVECKIVFDEHYMSSVDVLDEIVKADVSPIRRSRRRSTISSRKVRVSWKSPVTQ